jgi:hypothetical protein
MRFCSPECPDAYHVEEKRAALKWHRAMRAQSEEDQEEQKVAS